MSSPTDYQKLSKSNITSEYVKLNVGGTLFHTKISTLTKFKENKLSDMFSGRMDKNVDEDGLVFIDRSGKHFEEILNFLRDGTVPLPNLTKELAELRAEANFFCISQLVELCDQALVAPVNIHDILPSSIIIPAEPLNDKVIESLNKPAIVLELCEHHPQNLQFYENLAINFHEAILFIRYVGDRSINKWKLYSNGVLVKEQNLQNDMSTNGIYNGLATFLQKLAPKS